MRALRAVSAIAVIAVAAGSLSACSSIGAEPWERDLMAKRQMAVDPYPLQSGVLDHVYFSKEGASGGRGFAGGGCGCS